MTQKIFRVPMFFKFLAGCLLLAFLLIFGGTYVVHLETKMKSRGNYLSKHFKRYIRYQEGLGRALVSVTDLISNSGELRRAMAGLEPDAAAGGDDDTGTATPADLQAARDTAKALAVQAFSVLSSKYSVQPDLMLIFDDQGGHVWSTIKVDDNTWGSFAPEELGEMKAVDWIRSGSYALDQILIHDGRAYQIAGVPLRRTGGKRILGGLIVGTALDRYMIDYMQQSDARKHMQHRLVLLHKNKVVAGVLPGTVRQEVELLLTARGEQRHFVQDAGDKYRQWIVTLSRGDKDSNLPAGDYDVYGPDHPQDNEATGLSQLNGFAGLESGVVGELYLIRSRSNLKGRGPKIPWGEMVVGILLSLAIAWFLALWITRPIKSFVRQTRQILTGETDLTQRIQIRSRDETQALARNINKAFERLYNLASDVQGAAFQVGASSAEISAASKQMLGGLREQTEKVQGSTAAVTELSASIQQVAENAAEATNVAEKSNVAVTSAVTRMEQIRSAVEDAADKMQDLGESSKRIGNIVEVIRQISEQTSLLALNASIEAAHAGEQGRGFAVVADEVSSLARRVGQSAKDIETLIQTIKEQTTEAMSSMQLGTREVEEGTHLVTNTLTDLQNLIDVVKDTASAVREQAVVSDEIARNMDAVQSITTEVLSGSEESVLQAEQLHTLAFNLEESVNGFNLESSPAGRSGSPGRGTGPGPAHDHALRGRDQRATPRLSAGYSPRDD